MLKNNSTEKNMPDRNYLVDIFRLFFAIQIVLIHTSPFSNVKGTIFHALISLLSQSAVPFFFFVSAYFYLNRLLAGKAIFKKQERKLLITYLLWSIVYYATDFLLLLYHKADKVEYIKLLKHSILTFITTGSSFQLWYLVALIFCVAIVTIFYKKLSMSKFCMVAILLFTLYVISNHTVLQTYISEISVKSLPFLNIYSLFINVIRGMIYFTLAYSFICCEKLLIKISIKPLGIAFSGTILIYIIYYYVNLGIDPIREVLPLLRIIILLLLMVWLLLIQHRSINISNDFVSGAAAFTYYFHPLAAMTGDIILYSILGITISNNTRFILTVVTCMVGAFILYKWNNKILNHLYK